MPLTTREFNLCVIPSKFPPHVHLSQYDTAVQCTANLVDESGAAFTIPSGATAVLEGINKKNVAFKINADDVSTTSITFTPDRVLTDCYGQLRTTLKIGVSIEDSQDFNIEDHSWIYYEPTLITFIKKKESEYSDPEIISYAYTGKYLSPTTGNVVDAGDDTFWIFPDVSVQEGEIYYITSYITACTVGSSTVSTTTYVILDSHGQVLDRGPVVSSQAGETITDHKIVIPSGGAILRMARKWDLQNPSRACYLRKVRFGDDLTDHFSPLEIIFEIQKCGVTDDEAASSAEFRNVIEMAFNSYINEHGVSDPNAVLFVQQSLTSQQKETARNNIGVTDQNAVLYTQQTLNLMQQRIARENIGADIQRLIFAVYNNTTASNIISAIVSDKIVVCIYNNKIYYCDSYNSSSQYVHFTTPTGEDYVEVTNQTWANGTIAQSSSLVRIDIADDGSMTIDNVSVEAEDIADGIANGITYVGFWDRQSDGSEMIHMYPIYNDDRDSIEFYGVNLDYLSLNGTNSSSKQLIIYRGLARDNDDVLGIQEYSICGVPYHANNMSGYVLYSGSGAGYSATWGSLPPSDLRLDYDSALPEVFPSWGNYDGADEIYNAYHSGRVSNITFREMDLGGNVYELDSFIADYQNQVITGIVFSRTVSPTSVVKVTYTSNQVQPTYSYETVNPVLYSVQSLTDPQKAQARTNIGAQASVIRETVSGTSATLDTEVDTLYLCGEMTALTIDTYPPTGIFSVVFTSGTTATVLTVPQTLIMPDGFTVEANKRYEINVMDGYAVVAEWTVSSS